MKYGRSLVASSLRALAAGTLVWVAIAVGCDDNKATNTNPVTGSGGTVANQPVCEGGSNGAGGSTGTGGLTGNSDGGAPRTGVTGTGASYGTTGAGASPGSSGEGTPNTCPAGGSAGAGVTSAGGSAGR
jgi:hypothetical protein